MYPEIYNHVINFRNTSQPVLQQIPHPEIAVHQEFQLRIQQPEIGEGCSAKKCFGLIYPSLANGFCNVTRIYISSSGEYRLPVIFKNDFSTCADNLDAFV